MLPCCGLTQLPMQLRESKARQHYVAPSQYWMEAYVAACHIGGSLTAIPSEAYTVLCEQLFQTCRLRTVRPDPALYMRKGEGSLVQPLAGPAAAAARAAAPRPAPPSAGAQPETDDTLEPNMYIRLLAPRQRRQEQPHRGRRRPPQARSCGPVDTLNKRYRIRCRMPMCRARQQRQWSSARQSCRSWPLNRAHARCELFHMHAIVCRWRHRP